MVRTSVNYRHIAMKSTLSLFFLLVVQLTFAQNGYFFPEGSRFDPAIPSPEQFPGYHVGEWHPRHDWLNNSFQSQEHGGTETHRDAVRLHVSMSACLSV